MKTVNGADLYTGSISMNDIVLCNGRTMSEAVREKVTPELYKKYQLHGLTYRGDLLVAEPSLTKEGDDNCLCVFSAGDDYIGIRQKFEGEYEGLSLVDEYVEIALDVFKNGVFHIEDAFGTHLQEGDLVVYTCPDGRKLLGKMDAKYGIPYIDLLRVPGWEADPMVEAWGCTVTKITPRGRR